MNLEYKDDIARLLRKSSLDLEYELECIIGGPINDLNNKDDFMNVLKRLKGKQRFSRMTKNNTLLISFDNYDKDYSIITKHLSRVVINGNGLINQYIKTNSLKSMIDNVKFESKYIENINKDIIKDENYNIRFNLKKEKDIAPTNTHIINLIKEWHSIKKYFRRKTTYTFYEEEDDFKIDISMVSSNYNKMSKYSKTIQESNVLYNRNITYELEVEYIGNKKDNIKDKFHVKFDENKILTKKEKNESEVTTYTNYIADKFINIINIILQAKYKTFFVIGYRDKLNVNKSFKSLVKDDKSTFLPNVIDLEHKNILQLPIFNYLSNDYDKNIRIDYAVTDKTDGIRYLLFIDNIGKCYFKGRDSENNEIKSYNYTGTIIKEYANSLFDGELINKTLDGKTIQNFYIFDAYFSKGKNLTRLPFGNKTKPDFRYYHIVELEKHFEKSDTILQDDSIPPLYLLKIFKKVFYYGDTSDKLKSKMKGIDINDSKEIAKVTSKYDKKIFDGIDKILKKCNIMYGGTLKEGHMYSYPLDGLIFQPVNLGVNQEHLGKPAKKIGGTWNSAFRWKPSNELTIDFKVKFNKNAKTGKYEEYYYKNNKYIQATLFCKLWKSPVHKNMLAYKLVNNGDIFEKYNEDYAFSPIYPYNGERIKDSLLDNTSQIYLLVDNQNKIRCVNNDIINDGNTIECMYDFKKEKQFRWVPKKARYNKTPNAFMTAMGAWKLINNPITTKMILNKEKANMTEDYYNKQQSTESKSMRHFHNFVKEEIIKRGLKGPSSKSSQSMRKSKKTLEKEDLSLNIISNKSVLDLGGGRGGDFFKYKTNGANKLILMDISPDNIYNVEKGAAVRIMKSSFGNQYFKSFISNSMLILGDMSKNIANGDAALDNLNKYYLDILYGRIKPKSGKLSRMFNVGINGFDLVVCNLAIHYMFKSKDILHNFLENVQQNLVSKGYFIGTFLDGNEIIKSLKDKTKIEGYHKKTKKLVWSIEKVNPKDDLFEDNNFINQRIIAYMDTFMKPTEEYLVDIDFLEKEANKYDLELIDSKMFIDKQDSMFSKYKIKNEENYKNIEMNDIIKQWCSFHRWFMFQKK